MIMALSVLLVACNQPAKTAIQPRWEKNETHVFNISLADFAKNSNEFNAYNAKGELAGDGTYFKDISFANEFVNWDEIKPVAVRGMYRIDIEVSGDKSICEVTTSQVMYVKYNLKSASVDGVDFEKYGALREAEQKAEADAIEYKALGLTKDEGTTILKSTTDTYVKFENTPSQTPLSSWVKVDGFYVGKVAQELSNYNIATEYDYSTNAPVAKIKLGEESSEYKFPGNSAGSFIDSNQILMYVRSLDKSSTSFQDNPGKSVFNPFSKSLQTASFGATYMNGISSLTRNAVLTDTVNERTLTTNLNVVSVFVGTSPFMVQQNLPNTLKLGDKQLDTTDTIQLGEPEHKFTTVRFRVGYFAYEIDYSHPANTSNWSEIWTALTPAEE